MSTEKKGKDKEMRYKQYEMMVNSSIKVSEWRQNVNKFYLTLNTGIASIISGLNALGYRNLTLILPIFGLIISVIWFLHLKEFKKLNKSKFDIILKIEKDLPFQLFQEEWNSLNKDEYKQLTSFEKYVPVAFIVIFVLVMLSQTIFSLYAQDMLAQLFKSF